MVAQPIDRERAIESAREVSQRGELREELEWVKFLSRPHLMMFAVELRDCLRAMGETGDSADLLELLDAWEATAELDADDEAADELLRPRDRDDFVEWTSGKRQG